MIRGPFDFKDYDLVKEVADEYVDGVKMVELVTDIRPQFGFPTYHPMRSSFYFGDKWFAAKWKENAIRDGDKKNFSTVHHLFQESRKAKLWKESAEKRRLEMVKMATDLIAFVELGEEDYETERILALSKVYDLRIQVVRL
jgi:hypothetical protein